MSAHHQPKGDPPTLNLLIDGADDFTEEMAHSGEEPVPLEISNALGRGEELLIRAYRCVDCGRLHLIYELGEPTDVHGAN